MPTYAQTITGTSGDDILVGGSGNDHISSTGGHDEVNGGAGDDYLLFRGHGGELTGGSGNDILDAGKMGYGQYHFYAGSGDDLMLMDLTNKEGWGHQQLHAYGHDGNDTFSFSDVQGAEIDTMVRLDDFNSTRDKLVIEGRAIDLANLPSGLRVVSYLGQQWLHINNDTSANNADPLKGDILIALDGARQMPDGEEVHFSPFPANADALPAVAYLDDNYVPFQLYAAREASLRAIVSDAASVAGSQGGDYIYGAKNKNLPVGMASTISALGGDDVIEAGSGHDTVNGGAGNDLVSGGLDKDTLLGGAGDDRLMGGSEDDRLDGGKGADALLGGRGNDGLAGGNGRDSLRGDAGADDFIYTATKESGSSDKKRDRIEDFAGKDEIILKEIDADATRKGNQAFELDRGGAFEAGEIRVKDVKAGTVLEMNVDNDAKAEMSILLAGYDGKINNADFDF